MSAVDPLDLLERERPPRRETGRAVGVGVGLLAAAVAGTVALGFAPAPYVVERPGPVYDTLGAVETADGEVPLIEISGEETYPTSGRLDLLTVYIDGSRENPLSWIDLAAAWFDPSRTVLPVDAVYPDGQTEEEAGERSALQMDSSQQAAVAAALRELGIPVSGVVVVAGVMEDVPAVGVLEEGDEILAVDGEPLADGDALRAAVAEAGIGGRLDLTIRRAGAERTVTLSPAASPADGAPVIGIYTGTRFEFPVDVAIQLERVGGPSAGMMFALAIYDKLTPGELAGGAHIAGTGTIAADGQVGTIGGVVQKMHGAVRAGAEWFLLPAANCAQSSGNVPGDLEVVPVADLAEAISVVESIASGDTAALPRCR